MKDFFWLFVTTLAITSSFRLIHKIYLLAQARCHGTKQVLPRVDEFTKKRRLFDLEGKIEKDVAKKIFDLIYDDSRKIELEKQIYHDMALPLVLITFDYPLFGYLYSAVKIFDLNTVWLITISIALVVINYFGLRIYGWIRRRNTSRCDQNQHIYLLT